MGLFKSIGKTFKSAGHSISHAFKDTGKTIGKGVSSVYNDAKGGVSDVLKFTGKEIDKIGGAVTSTITILPYALAGGAILFIYLNSR